ncbi:hypothetical protein BWD42_24065 [Sphingobacterium sp. CZ-UAM]|uniref:hypothetical protein n=1 Tax=Sphingobacterium sp. CZ-UAM TaxID=1933868 RepID=UPI00098586D2|nr:hypothetical protein [Sphingobacterium sp. CZ-UAM]OOG15758.1 hypothetical protein BWD42_24065 [Sphingobacterium sp. CZ-UAM]
MKTFNKNFASKFALAAYLALGTLAVTSCNKDTQNGQEVPNGKAQVIVRIAGISDGEEIKTKGSNRGSSAQHNLQLVQSNGFDALIGVDNQLPVSEIATADQSGIKAANGTRAASPVVTGTKYRLFLYKKNGTDYTFEKSVELSAGTETPVSVTDGATYKWVALSYNSTTTQVPEMQNIALPGNTDVLRATNEFTVSGAAVPINVNFSRVFARIGIELNTMGMFAPINSATVAVTGNNAKTGTLDVATGTFVGALTDVTAALTYADFVTAPGSDGQQKIAYYYTADQTQQSLNVSVSALKIKLEDGSERSFGATLTRGQVITPERGKNHRFLLGITESPLTFGGVQWSRSNLYYQAGYNPYRFYHFNQPTTDAKSFFSYGAAKPGVLGTYASPKDPCALVYPAGLWKTPAKADLDPINSNGLTGLLGDLNLNVLGSTLDALVDVQNALAANVTGATAPVNAGYSEFTATGVNAAYGAATSATNKLRFNFNGFMRDLSLVEDLITLDLGTTGGKYTAFWTNDRSLLDPLEPIAGLGVTHYLGNRYAGVPPLNLNAGYKGFRSTNVLGITLLNSVNVIKSSLMNVRCVRNGAWNPNAVGYNPNPVLPN